MKKFLLICFLTGAAAMAFAGPVVDGTVGASEYTHSKKIISGTATLYWAGDGKGGVSIAMTASAKGWAGVGLGSSRMSGAAIYMGFLGGDGKPVFSEQIGKGHRHSDSGKKTVDQQSVTQVGGKTTLEFHIPADKLPFKGTSVPFIAAFSDSADLETFHGDNYDTGTIALP